MITEGEPAPTSVRHGDRELATQLLDDGELIVELDDDAVELDEPLEVGIRGGRALEPEPRQCTSFHPPAPAEWASWR